MDLKLPLGFSSVHVKVFFPVQRTAVGLTSYSDLHTLTYIEVIDVSWQSCENHQSNQDGGGDC